MSTAPSRRRPGDVVSTAAVQFREESSEVFEKLLPDCVQVVESREDHLDTLFAGEEAVIAHAVDKRRREFTTVRCCARSALARLGVAPTAILRGKRGAPVWPPGVVGSMSHCAGYRVSAVAWRRCVLSLGVDVEEHAPLLGGSLTSLALPRERQDIRRLTADHADVYWDRLFFSVKESVYKAWFPLTRRGLRFHDVTVEVDVPTSSFRAVIDAPTPCGPASAVRELVGSWAVEGGFILTAVTLLAPTAAAPHRHVSPLD